MTDTEREAMEAAKFIIWIDYGYEGWSPTTFKDEATMLAYIAGGVHSGFVVTRGTVPLTLRPEVSP